MHLVNPYIFGVAFVGVLDAFTTGLASACGLTRMLGAYSGPLLRVRRSSDNAEQDIGYLTLGELDAASLATFVGANNGFIVKWYDQSGAANDLVQATAGAQPQIVFAGVIMPDILTDGVDDKLVTSAVAGTTTGVTVFFGGRIRGEAAGSTQGYAFGRTDITGPTFTRQSQVYRSNTSAGSLVCAFRDAPTKPAQIACVRYDLTQSTDAARISLFLNGSAQTQIDSSGSVPSNFGANLTYVGCDGSGTAGFARIAVRSFVMYATAVTTGNIGTISTALAVAPMPIDPLQSYTTSLWSATSHNRLRSGYAGSVIRVRRASDNTEQDIGVVAGYLDTASLATFCSGTNGFVTKRYDQSGNANDWAQATQANQPKVYDSSAGYLAHDDLDGSNDSFSTANSSGTPTAVTAYLRGKLAPTGTNVVLEHSTNYNSNDSMVSYYDSSRYSVGTHKISAAGYSVSNFDEYFSNTAVCLRSDRSQVTGAAQSALLHGGRLITRASSGDTGTLPTGNMSAQRWYVGGRASTSLFATMWMNDLVIYETAHSDATANLISYLLGG